MGKKIKFVNKYDTYTKKEGIYQKGESLTDQSQAEDSEIYSCIEKYGIQSLIRQTMAKEPLYLDNTNRDLNVADAMRLREQMDEYFKQMPARARKIFGDNPEEFYQRYKAGEYNKFIETGAFTEEQIKIMKEEQKNEDSLEQSNQDIHTKSTNSMENSGTTMESA